MPGSPGRTIAYCPGPAALDGRRPAAPVPGPRRSGGVAKRRPSPGIRRRAVRGSRTAPACRLQRATPGQSSLPHTGRPDFAPSQPPVPAPAAPAFRSTGHWPQLRLAAAPDLLPRPPGGSCRHQRRRRPARDWGDLLRRCATAPGADRVRQTGRRAVLRRTRNGLLRSRSPEGPSLMDPPGPAGAGVPAASPGPGRCRVHAPGSKRK